MIISFDDKDEKTFDGDVRPAVPAGQPGYSPPLSLGTAFRDASIYDRN
jgi:hypothetical protein